MKLSTPTSINTFEYFVTSTYRVNALDKDEADSLFWSASVDNDFDDKVTICDEVVTRIGSYRDGAEVHQFNYVENKWVQVKND